MFFEHANVELTANLKHLRSITFALTLANAKVTIRLSFSDQFRFGYKNYLNCIKNDKHRISLTRLRCSAHKLAIEEGRFGNIEQSERKCKFCQMNVVEDKF